MARKPAALKKKDIEHALQELSDWEPNAKQTVLSKTFSFRNFISGLSFVAKITVHAEVMGHHPDIELSYGKVKVKLTTHDAKGLTKKDFELARKIDGLKKN